MALWAIAFFVFFQFWYPYHFFFQEQNQLFLWSWDYISTYNHNGGLALLLGDFLTQFYYYLYVGAIILTICLLLVGTLLYKALARMANKRTADGCSLQFLRGQNIGTADKFFRDQ